MWCIVEEILQWEMINLYVSWNKKVSLAYCNFCHIYGNIDTCYNYYFIIIIITIIIILLVINCAYKTNIKLCNIITFICVTLNPLC